MANLPTGYPSIDKPWLKYWSEESKTCKLPNCSIYDLLESTARNHLDYTAIEYFGKKLSYKEFLVFINQVANSFKKLGVGKNDVVSICSVSTPEIIASIYALDKIGASANIIEPRTNPERIQKFISFTDSKVLLVLDSILPKIEPILDKTCIENTIVISAMDSASLIAKMAYGMKNNKSAIDISKYQLWKNFFVKDNSTFESSSFDENHPAVFVYTSGTTGVPKGVKLSDAALNSVAVQMGYMGIFNEGKPFLNIMPPFIAYGVTCGIHLPLCNGMKVVVVPNFSPDKFGDLVKKYKPASIMGVPAFYEALAQSKSIANMDLSFIECAGVGGDSFNISAEKKVNDFLANHNVPYKISKGYGMTEICSAAVACFAGYNKLGSVGIPFAQNVVSIFNPDTCEECTYNQDGEICFQVPSQMIEYHKNEEETKNILQIHSDGSSWIHSGDFGHMDEDGYVFIVGRIKRIIVRPDGHNVWPSVIENVLSEHEKIERCAVVAANSSNRKNGRYPVAFVEPIDDDYDEEKLRKELFDLQSVKIHERESAEKIYFIKEIPFTNVGKVDYQALEKLTEEL